MNAYSASWTATFNTRTAAFIAALSIPTQKAMQTAWNMVWKNNEKAMAAAQKIKKTSVQNAWSVYRTDLKGCGTPMAKQLMKEKGGNDLND